jgi:hypothetical protein
MAEKAAKHGVMPVHRRMQEPGDITFGEFDAKVELKCGEVTAVVQLIEEIDVTVVQQFWALPAEVERVLSEGREMAEALSGRQPATPGFVETTHLWRQRWAGARDSARRGGEERIRWRCGRGQRKKTEKDVKARTKDPFDPEELTELLKECIDSAAPMLCLNFFVSPFWKKKFYKFFYLLNLIVKTAQEAPRAMGFVSFTNWVIMCLNMGKNGSKMDPLKTSPTMSDCFRTLKR